MSDENKQVDPKEAATEGTVPPVDPKKLVPKIKPKK